MSDPAKALQMSPAEYLAWEREQHDKHEFHLGSVFAMAGGSPRHNFLSSAAGAEIRAAVRGRDCHVLSSGQRIAAGPGERYVYADAVAACGGMRTEPGASDVLTNPAVIVEVLSQSTEKHDRGQKWEACQRLESLADYLLVSQGSVRVEHFQRERGGSWKYRVYGAGDEVVLANGAMLAVDAVYEGAFDLAAD